MAAMKFLLCLPFALLLSFSALRADDPSGSDERRCADLVRQLGDDSFEVREQAAKMILQMGVVAKPALQEGTSSTDPEVRRRCRALLPMVIAADRKARLAAFIADTDGVHDHDHLPGWERFRQVAGNERPARDLFASVLQAESDFLGEVAEHPEVAGERCAARCRRVFQHAYEKPDSSPGTIGLPELAAILLVAGDPAVDVPLEAEQTIGNLLQHPSARTALSATGNPAFRKLVLAWMKRQTEDDETAQQMFFVVRNLGLREGLDLAVDVLRNKPVKDRGLAAAMTTVGKYGSKEHRKLLQGFLPDTTLIGKFKLGTVRGTTQLRDVALAMLVHQTGQDFADYGFALGNGNRHLKFSASFLGFENDERRIQAFARWKAWAAEK
jgi:hypothetical protein